MKKSFLILAIASFLLNACSSNASETGESTNMTTAAAPETEEAQAAVSASIPGEDPEALKETNPSEPLKESAKAAEINTKPVMLNAASFKEKVFNYEKNPNAWVYEGGRPCIIDFYADWCKPCKLVAPIMDELAEKYAGQVDIYKVDTQVERELAQVFGIRSIPSVLFCPAEGQPQMTQGALPKETYEQVIKEFLLAKKPAVQ